MKKSGGRRAKKRRVIKATKSQKKAKAGAAEARRAKKRVQKGNQKRNEKRAKKAPQKVKRKATAKLARVLARKLGGFLLRGFHARRTPPKVRKKLKPAPRKLKLSRITGLGAPVPTEIPAHAPAETPQVSPAVQPTLAAVPAVAAEALPVGPVSEPTPEYAEPKKALSTQDVLRPNDELRKSIEAFLLDQRSPHTRRAYGKDLKRFVLFLHSRKQEKGIEKLNRLVLIAYKESLLAEKLEHTSVDRHIATLRSFFRWLVDDGVLEKSPADGIRFLNPKRLSTTRGFTDDEVRNVLMLPDLHTRVGSQHYAILMILFYCGLRRSEICELRTRHVGVERNQHVLRLRGKGNKERLIVLVPAVWHSIRHFLMITGRDLSTDDFLFKPLKNNRTGVLKKALDPSMIFYIVTKYARDAGITERVSPHSCRATAISNARDHNVPDRAIQEFAGWASPDMITRYDKRKTSIENSAAHSITYGAESRRLPEAVSVNLASSASTSDTESEAKDLALPEESQ